MDGSSLDKDSFPIPLSSIPFHQMPPNPNLSYQNNNQTLTLSVHSHSLEQVPSGLMNNLNDHQGCDSSLSSQQSHTTLKRKRSNESKGCSNDRAKYLLKHRESDARRREKEKFFFEKLNHLLLLIDPKLSHSPNDCLPRSELLEKSCLFLQNYLNILDNNKHNSNNNNPNPHSKKVNLNVNNPSKNYFSSGADPHYPWLTKTFSDPNISVVVTGDKIIGPNNQPILPYYDANEAFCKSLFVRREDIFRGSMRLIGHLSVLTTPETKLVFLKMRQGLIDQSEVSFFLSGIGINRFVKGTCVITRDSSGNIKYMTYYFENSALSKNVTCFQGDVLATPYSSSLIDFQNIHYKNIPLDDDNYIGGSPMTLKDETFCKIQEYDPSLIQNNNNNNNENYNNNNNVAIINSPTANSSDASSSSNELDQITPNNLLSDENNDHNELILNNNNNDFHSINDSIEYNEDFVRNQNYENGDILNNNDNNDKAKEISILGDFFGFV